MAAHYERCHSVRFRSQKRGQFLSLARLHLDDDTPLSGGTALVRGQCTVALCLGYIDSDAIDSGQIDSGAIDSGGILSVVDMVDQH